MSGTATVTKMPRKTDKPELVMITPEKAIDLLEHNTHNRPLSNVHVQRIARQIIDNKWKFNGDTIKVAKNGDVLDGQHRLWAVIESKKSIETIIVYGIERDAFATIDTVRRLRSGADTLALNGVSRYRNIISSALAWLLRWQNGIETYRDPRNKIENSDIEAAWEAYPGMGRAVERAMQLRRLANPSLVGFFYYVLSNRKADLAERMMTTLEHPEGVSVEDPYFRLRAYFTADHHAHKDPLMTIALMIKATNAAHSHKRIKTLVWRSQGKAAENFPELDI